MGTAGAGPHTAATENATFLAALAKMVAETVDAVAEDAEEVVGPSTFC